MAYKRGGANHLLTGMILQVWQTVLVLEGTYFPLKNVIVARRVAIFNHPKFKGFPNPTGVPKSHRVLRVEICSWVFFFPYQAFTHRCWDAFSESCSTLNVAGLAVLQKNIRVSNMVWGKPHGFSSRFFHLLAELLNQNDIAIWKYRTLSIGKTFKRIFSRSRKRHGNQVKEKAHRMVDLDIHWLA